jgi:hypothetical protein
MYGSAPGAPTVKICISALVLHLCSCLTFMQIFFFTLVLTFMYILLEQERRPLGVPPQNHKAYGWIQMNSSSSTTTTTVSPDLVSCAV